LRRRSRSLRAGPTLAAFRIQGYPALWISSAAWAFGSTVSVVAIGWITLQVSNSAFAVGLAFAARLVPALVLGIPLGSAVDRYDRRRTLVVAGLLWAAPTGVLAVLAGAGQLGLGSLLALSLVLGIIETLRGTAAQSYAFDLAGPGGATNAIALANLGGFLVGVVGSIAGGGVLDGIGATGAFVLAAGIAILSAAVLVPGGQRRRGGSTAPRVAPSFARAMTLILRNRVVAVVAFVVIVAEVLGFSCATLFPTFARDVLQSDASGLGAITASRYLGAIVALLLVARATVPHRGGRLILLATAGLGLSLVAFALSRSLVLSLGFVFAVGIASAALDTLVQSLLQRSVGEGERGSAMGVWYFAIGFGPIGQLGLGAAANALGAPAALAVSGGLLALIALALAVARTIRQLDAGSLPDERAGVA
jgi:MFS family permease